MTPHHVMPFLAATAILSGCFFAQPTHAALMRTPELTMWENGGSRTLKEPFGIRGTIIGSLAYGDLGSDGTDELVVGSGQGMEPLVTVQREDGSRIFRFYAFPKSIRQGVNVAVGDVDGDGVSEIITAPAFGTAPSIKLFTNFGRVKVKSATSARIKHELTPFSNERVSGLSIAAGDVNGDGTDELIAAEGPLGRGEVRVLTGDGTILATFSPFDAVRGMHGINVAAGDMDGDGVAEIIAAEASQGSRVSVWKFNDLITPHAEWSAFHTSFVGGVRVAYGTEGGAPAILASVAGAGTPLVKSFDAKGGLLAMRTTYEATYDGGVIAVSGRTKLGERLVTAPTAPIFYPGKTVDKLAEVDLTEQRLFAWEHDYLMRTFLISSGLSKTPTPVGDFTVLAKPLYVNYTRIYGPDDPRNYDFPNTRYNLMFKKSYYIHTAWWHNNFGHPMSHGCVNTFVEDAAWMYAWAPIGTPVKIAKSLAAPSTLASIHTP